MKYDFIKIQKEFDKYKLENRNKTLKDFCKARNLNYESINNKIKVKKVLKKSAFYDRQKNRSFSRTLKEKAIEEGKKEGLNFVRLMEKLNVMFYEVYAQFEILAKKKNAFKNCVEAVKCLTYIVNSISDLQKLKLMKESSLEGKADVKDDEDLVFWEMLNARTTDGKERKIGDEEKKVLEKHKDEIEKLERLKEQAEKERMENGKLFK